MCKNIQRIRREWPTGQDVWNITPPTFILPEDGRKFVETVQNSSDLWISKPVAASCGKGIRILHSGSPGLEKLSKKYQVVQKYVNPPLLIRGYKLFAQSLLIMVLSWYVRFVSPLFYLDFGHFQVFSTPGSAPSGISSCLLSNNQRNALHHDLLILDTVFLVLHGLFPHLLGSTNVILRKKMKHIFLLDIWKNSTSTSSTKPVVAPLP